MTVSERLLKIDRVTEKRYAEEEAKMKAYEEEYDKLCNTIYNLTDRIKDLIEVGNYALENDISLIGRTAWGGHEGYDTKLFCSNGWSHLVGFITRKDSPIEMLGIINGGACGNVDFFTNGKEIIGIEQGSKKTVLPRIKDMYRFVKEFDEFETEFYKYIDNL